MKKLAKVWTLGIVQAVIVLALLAGCLTKVTDTYQIYFSEAQLTAKGDQVEVLVSGANLFRPNSFYIDGKRIADPQINRISYEACRFTLNRDVFGEAGDWHKLEVGFCKWGFIHLLSTPVWIEMPDLSAGST